jgi:SAM-dependent methyltransferase
MSLSRYHRDRPLDVHSQARSAPYRYVARELEDAVLRFAIPATSAGSKVLDYGCAAQPYRALFGPGIEYVGADLEGNALADVLLDDDGSVPLPDAQFDLVLSTQVLEHVANPELYVSECRRLLKPGGTLVITTHGIMFYHPDPVDYWRWTSAGLGRILSSAGLCEVEIRGIMGLAPTAVQLFQHATTLKVPGRLRRPYIAVTQTLVELLDRAYSEESRLANSLVLAARAQRPEG